MYLPPVHYLVLPFYVVVFFLLVGNDVSQETVDSASVFLFNLFIKDQTWSRRHSEEIKRTLGPFPASAASNACKIVKRIILLLPEDWISKSDETELSNKLVMEFGHNIVFKHVESQKPSATNHGNSSGYDSLSDDEQASSDQKSELISGLFYENSSSEVVSEVKESVPTDYSGEWLKQQCQSCSSGGFDWQDLYKAVFELLSSPSDNSGIENDVSIISNSMLQEFSGWFTILWGEGEGGGSTIIHTCAQLLTWLIC